LQETWSIIHGAGFGLGLLLLFPLVIGGLVLLGRRWLEANAPDSYLRFLVGGAWILTSLAWLTDIMGTYLPYPRYRVQPPHGATNLRDFARSYLLSRSDLAIWENIGMKWKEHLGWIVPILCTAAVYIILVYGWRLADQPRIRKAVMTLLMIAFIAAGITGYLGILITKLAPVR